MQNIHSFAIGRKQIPVTESINEKFRIKEEMQVLFTLHIGDKAK